MKAKKIFITKANGQRALFSSGKLQHSLKRSGASEEVVESIIEKVSEKLFDGIPTKKIYQLAFSLLKQESKSNAAKYKLKRAIMELGPSGFAFEHYYAEILKYQGYHADVGQFLEGKCVSHEVDVIAHRGNEHLLVECKFHNFPGVMCDVKIPLYVHARFSDIEAIQKKKEGPVEKHFSGWLVTNTRFSGDAIQFGNCAGLNLLSWDYPEHKGLKDLIDSLRLFPLTCLSTLSKTEKNQLLEKKIVLCLEVCSNEKYLKAINIEPERIKKILDEANQLCKGLSANSNQKEKIKFSKNK